MIVVDASALLESVVGDQPDPELVMRLASDELHAPHLVDVEILHALRVLVTRNSASARRVEAARTDFFGLDITRYPHVPLANRMWELRRNLSAYDATYVALAEALEVPLVTTDERISRAPRLGAVIEVYQRAVPDSS